MKKFISVIATVLLAAGGCFAQVIGSNYKKVFVCDCLSIDYNQNGKVESDEAYEVTSHVTVDYKDYGSAGNFLVITTRLKTEDGETAAIASASFEDVELMNVPSDVTEGNYWGLVL